MKKLLLLSSLFALAFIGCKKSSSNSSCSLSASSIVGSYKMTSLVLTMAGQSIDIFNDDNYTEPCSRDNIYTLNGNGTYTVTDGAVACNPSDADQGTWSLSGNTFTMDGGDASTVSEFTCTSFKIVSSSMQGESTTATFARQ